MTLSENDLREVLHGAVSSPPPGTGIDTAKLIGRARVQRRVSITAAVAAVVAIPVALATLPSLGGGGTTAVGTPAASSNPAASSDEPPQQLVFDNGKLEFVDQRRTVSTLGAAAARQPIALVNGGTLVVVGGHGNPSTLALVSGGTVKTLAQDVTGFAVQPGGASVAVSGTQASGSALSVLALPGGAKTATVKVAADTVEVTAATATTVYAIAGDGSEARPISWTVGGMVADPSPFQVLAATATHMVTATLEGSCPGLVAVTSTSAGPCVSGLNQPTFNADGSRVVGLLKRGDVAVAAVEYATSSGQELRRWALIGDVRQLAYEGTDVLALLASGDLKFSAMRCSIACTETATFSGDFGAVWLTTASR